MKRKIIFILSGIVALLSFTLAIKDHSGKFHTAGLPVPGETTCSASGCHGAGNGSFTSGGFADNGGPGSIVLSSSNMPGWVYTPGVTYHMTITLTETGCSLFGFSAAVMDNGGRNAGTITVTDAAHTRKGSPVGSTLVYLTHTGGPTGPNPGYQLISTNPAVIIFDWTAPASNVGPVTFYFDGVATNNNVVEDAGDNVYAGTQIASPNTGSSLLMSSLSTIPVMTTAINVPSLSQSIMVAGGGLTGNVTVTMPTYFQVSLSSSSGFANSLVLTPTSGTLATTTLYVRYNPTVAGPASGNISLADAGSTTASIAVSGNTTSSATVFVNSLIASSFRTVVGVPSPVVKSFTVAGINLTANLVVSAITHYQVSLSSGSGFGSSVSLTPTSNTVNETTIYIRYNPSVAALHNGLVPVSSTGATTKYVTIGGLSVVDPTLTATGTLSAFSTTVGTPSTAQNFSISGSNLLTDVLINAPADFEISLSSGLGYGSNLTLVPNSGNLSSTIIYIRYNPFAAGSASGNIVISSIGKSSSVTKAVSGSSTNPAGPVVSSSSSLTTFSTNVGTPSATQTCNVSGLNLTANIVITAPTDFEISLSSGSGFGSSLNLTPSSGSVSSTTVYIRYNPGSAGASSGSISLASTSATTQNISVNGNATSTAIVNSILSNSGLSIYPNPLNGAGALHMNLSTGSVIIVSLLNYQGQIIKELYNNNAGGGELTIPFDLSGLSKGMYIIEVKAEGSSLRKQVVVE
jgi:hypothetical protein